MAGAGQCGLIEFCERYDAIELWINPDPNAQLNLIWLLDFLRSHEQLALKISLVQADVGIGGLGVKKLTRRQWPRVPIEKDHLEAAGVARSFHQIVRADAPAYGPASSAPLPSLFAP